MGKVPKIEKPSDEIFIVERTSRRGNDKIKPCSGSFRALVPFIDRRSVGSPEGLKHTMTPAEWYANGSNHRVEEGCIVRNNGWKEVWAVGIKDLRSFLIQHGECVVSVDSEGFNHIEIYDDIRE